MIERYARAHVCACACARRYVRACVCVRGWFRFAFLYAWVRACGCVRVCMCACGWGGLQGRGYFGARAGAMDLYDTPRTQRDTPRTQRAVYLYHEHKGVNHEPKGLFTFTTTQGSFPQTQWLFTPNQKGLSPCHKHKSCFLFPCCQLSSPQVTLLPVVLPQLSCYWLSPLVVLVEFLSPLLR